MVQANFTIKDMVIIYNETHGSIYGFKNKKRLPRQRARCGKRSKLTVETFGEMVILFRKYRTFDDGDSSD